MSESRGVYYVEDVVRGQWRAMDRDHVIRQVADADGQSVLIWIEQEPGSGGKEAVELLVRALAGWTVRADRPQTNLLARAGPLSAQAEVGNVRLVRGSWNEMFLSELHSFDGSGKGHDDQVAAAAGAFNKLALGAREPVEVLMLGEASAAPRRVTVRL